jgi:hypothetical protein
MITFTWRRGMFIGLAVWLSAAHVVAIAASQTGNALPLESLAGDYQAGPTTITVTLLQDRTLTLFLPGQPLYHLVPQAGLRYRIRELAAGYGIDFLRDARGTITGMTVHQPPPQQDFSATRKSGQATAGVARTPGPASSAPPSSVAASEPAPPTIARPPLPPTIPATGTAQGQPVTPPAPAASPRLSAQASGTSVAQTTGSGKRLTLVEGPSFEFPANWDAQEAHTSAYPTEPSKTAGVRATFDDDVLFELRQFPPLIEDLSLLRRPANERARYGLPAGPILDFELPGAQALFFRNEQGPGRIYYIFWVQLSGRVWTFECTEFSPAAAGLCASVMRSFQVRPPTMTQPSATNPASGAKPANEAVPAGGNVTSAISSQASASPPNASMAAPLNAEWAQVPGIEKLAPEQRAYALKEAGHFFNTCEMAETTTAAFGNFYQCPCIGRTMLTARLRSGFEMAPLPAAAIALGHKPEMKVPTGKLELDINACIAPEKITNWGAAWYDHKWMIAFRKVYPEESKEKMSKCVGRLLAQTFQAKPAPPNTTFSSLAEQTASDALVACRQENR